MSKRFEFYSDEDLIGVLDNVTGKTFNSFEIVDKLNEQQKEINELNQENADLLGDQIRSLEEFEKCTNKLKAKILQLQEENGLLKKKLESLQKILHIVECVSDE